jgi:hypothetical protein
MVLPYDRGPVKVLTVSTGSLKSLPFDHRPASPFLSVLLQAVPRLVFEVMKACCLLHLELISYFVLVLRAGGASSLLAWTRQATSRLQKKAYESSQCSYKECVLAIVIYVLVKTSSWWGVTRFVQPCICTDALSVLLSALYLYLLPRVLIRRRTCTSGAAGSSLFCALIVE